MAEWYRPDAELTLPLPTDDTEVLFVGTDIPQEEWFPLVARWLNDGSQPLFLGSWNEAHAIFGDPMAEQKPAVIQGDVNIAANGMVGNRAYFAIAQTIPGPPNSFKSVRVEYGESRVVEDGKTFGEVKLQVITSVMENFQEMANEVAKALMA